MRILLLLLLSVNVFGQQKQDVKTRSGLEKTITFLADDLLEGRRTGSAGEKMAYEFISASFKKAGLIAAGDDKTYTQSFDVKEGKEVAPSTELMVNGNQVEKDGFFPLAYSMSG